MAIPNTQRNAIETLVQTAGTSPIDLQALAGKTLTLDGRTLVLCGVSDGHGSHSRSSAKVAVFAFGQTASPRVPTPQRCDAAVLLRPPTKAEREAWSAGTALHALDVLQIDLAHDTARVSTSGHSTTYVPV